MRLKNLIAKGNTANIYLEDDKIIKVFNNDLSEKTVRDEVNKQKIPYSKGFFVPKIFNIIKIEHKWAIVMEYIQGKTLGNMVLSDKKNVDKYIKLSVDIQMKIHNIEAESLEFMSDKLTRQINYAKLLSDAQKEKLINKLNNMEYDKKLCHGDFHVFNIIMKNEKPFIIDWMDASNGDIYADVCRSYLLYLMQSVELANIYLNLYCENSGIEKYEILKWEAIIAGARLSEDLSDEESKRLFYIVKQYTEKN